MHKNPIFFLCLCCCLSAAAQRRIAVSPVAKAFHDGFHQILMDPVHRSIANPDLANVRLMDLGGKEIPYLLRKHGSVPIKDIRYTRTENKSIKVTHIHVKFPYPVEIERIRFKISGPGNFQRRAVITSDEVTGLYVNEISLKSKGDSIYTYGTSYMYTSSFDIGIENGNEPLLAIDDIKCFQPGTFIIADLKMADDYELVYFDSSMRAPSYDMRFFNGEITDELDLLKPGELKLLSSTNPGLGAMAEPEPSFWETTLFMWICIVLVAGVVVLVGGRMIRDMRERQSESESEEEDN